MRLSVLISTVMWKKRAASSSPSASIRVMSSSRAILSLSRWGAVELEHGGLSLIPRLRVLLSFVRADFSVRPFDEWHLRQSFVNFVRNSLSIIISEKDLSLHKHKNSRKRSDEALASGVLYIWDIQALLGEGRYHKEDADIMLQKKERMLIEKLTGVELNLGGSKLQCHARPEDRDDLFSLKRSWHNANEDQEIGLPDTMVLRGIPSRWLAELRVSSNASVLVTHTVFSQFGSIRNLDIQVNNSESLSCNVWVQFEHYSEFYNAMAAFCGRSMAKEGFNFKANYEVNWDNDGYFIEENIRKRKFEKGRSENSRDWQVFMEAQQAETGRRQAELDRFDQERKEVERIRRLREEETWRREREATIVEREMLKQKELECLKQEEWSRKEKFQSERIKREEEQKRLEAERREAEIWKLEEQMKEKQRADMRDRETWTSRLPRHGSHDVVNWSYHDSRRQRGKVGQEEERWAQTNSHGNGNGLHENNDREYLSGLRQARSVTGLPDVIIEDFKDNDLQRWVLDTGPSSFSKYTVGSELVPHKQRLRSVIVDSRQSM